jgi:hypothetical protein
MASHVSRTLELFRERGWTACVTERYNSFIKQKFDALGFGDLLACHEGPPPWIMLAQVCGADVAPHIEKMRAEPRMREWLKSGGCVYIYGWTKKGARGKRKVWTVREVEVVLNENEVIEFLEVE